MGKKNRSGRLGEGHSVMNDVTLAVEIDGLERLVLGVGIDVKKVVMPAVECGGTAAPRGTLSMAPQDVAF